MRSRKKIGIVGLGYVGGAVKHWFESSKSDLFLYDKYKNIGSPVEVNQADIIFVAVPTPFGPKGYDDSAVREVIKLIANGKVVVIKSTILPGSTENFQKKYPDKTILFNPEFLRAKTPVEDFLKPDKQIIGYSNDSGKSIAPQILSVLPPAPFVKIMKAREAEMVKYFNNAYLAARVIFANEMYDLCQKIKADYEVVKESVVQDKRIGDSHFNIFSDGYRGYGGACLPKDTKSLLQLSKRKKVNLKLLKTIDTINEDLTKNRKR